MSENEENLRTLALTPSWSVACVLTMFVAVSLIVERSIHYLSHWLLKTNRKPLFEALEKIKEELMLLGFISLLLTATSTTISNFCVNTKFYDSSFLPCTKSEVEDYAQENHSSVSHHSLRRLLNSLARNTCKEGYEPFVSYETLEQLHRFIFVMAITHISYSCLTMLLAIVKIHKWRNWEDEAQIDKLSAPTEFSRESLARRQTMLVRFHTSNPLARNTFFVWVTCFFQQFGQSVGHEEYLTLRMAFITSHNLTPKFDFHNYMIRSMEEEFPRIVGVSAPLWGFVVGFMLFNVKGSNFYFWIAIVPFILVLVVGTKLQHIIATLTWENAGITGFFSGTKLRPRDDLFWFKKPQLFLSLIHFVLFQNAFEVASFFWFWWQFGYDSCFIKNHYFVYIRLIMGFSGQFLCSYSTLPLYALATQMGTNYKAALIPHRIRQTLHGLKKSAKRKRRLGCINDDSTIRTEMSTVRSPEEYENQLYQSPNSNSISYSEVEIPPVPFIRTTGPDLVTENTGSFNAHPLWTFFTHTPKEDVHQVHGSPSVAESELQHTSIIIPSPSSGTCLLRTSSSVSPTSATGLQHGASRSSSMPFKRGSTK